MRRLTWLLVAAACAPTAFRGDAHFPGGPAACRATCARDGLEMSGFVYSGEFSTSCVCRPAGVAAAPEAVADLTAAVGVVENARRERETQRRRPAEATRASA